MAPPRGGPPTATSKPTTPGDAYEAAEHARMERA
jgi:hypothetical protein